MVNRVDVEDGKPVVEVNWAHIVDLARQFAREARSRKAAGSETVLAHLVAITQRTCEAQGTVVAAQIEPIVRDIVEQFLIGLRTDTVPFHFTTEVSRDPDPKRGIDKDVQGVPRANGAARQSPRAVRGKRRVRL